MARITIKGSAFGTGLTGDHVGFAAERIGAFSAGGLKLPLTAGADTVELAILSGDLTVRDF